MAEENATVLEPIQFTKKIEGKKILSVEVKRNQEGWLEIKLQSPIDWKVFKRTTSRDILRIGNIECYYPKSDTYPGLKSYFYNDNVFEYNDYPNLNLLLAKEIDKGVTFVFNTFPVSDQKIRTWLQRFNEQIKILYLSYCKPINISLVITSETIEREMHD